MKTPRPKKLKQHYHEIGSSYDRLYHTLFGGSRQEVTEFIAGKLKKSAEKKTIVDIGGGTGETIERLKKITGSSDTFILVEPYSSMSAQALNRQGKPNLILNASAEEFVSQTTYWNGVDLLICQEMIHLVPDLKVFFQGAYQVLKKEGAIVIITRTTEIEFPFGKHGKKIWKELYPISPQEMPTLLEEQGFRVEVERRAFPLQIPKALWLEIVGSHPLFSMYASFTEQQKREDYTEIQSKDEVLHFNDHQIFIVGWK